MSQDTFVPSGGQTPSGGGAAPVRTPIDRFEMKQQWTERTEEEREAMSQELKLKQMCQDIAALIMVDELEDGSDEEE